MSGHSKWSTIKHKKAARDSARGDVFTKMAKNIVVAVKKGSSGDPETNFSLRLVMDKARAVNMPKEKIERAIERGLGKAEGEDYQELLLEGYGPGGVGILIEAVTDNHNRTVSEVKNMLEKAGGRLGPRGSVSYLFEVVAGEGYKAKYGGGEQSPQVMELVTKLKEHDDVQEVYTP